MFCVCLCTLQFISGTKDEALEFAKIYGVRLVMRPITFVIISLVLLLSAIIIWLFTATNLLIFCIFVVFVFLIIERLVEFVFKSRTYGDTLKLHGQFSQGMPYVWLFVWTLRN